MHLYIMTRGIKHDRDQFITQLQGKYFMSKFQDHDGIIKERPLQLSVRPIEMYEIVFPEASKDIVLNSILHGKTDTQHKKHNKFVWGIRKALGVDKIPNYKKDQEFPIYNKNIEIVPIGIKPDLYCTKEGKLISNPSDEVKKDCWEYI